MELAVVKAELKTSLLQLRDQEQAALVTVLPYPVVHSADHCSGSSASAVKGISAPFTLLHMRQSWQGKHRPTKSESLQSAEASTWQG